MNSELNTIISQISSLENLLKNDNISIELRASYENAMKQTIKEYVKQAHKYSITPPAEGGKKNCGPPK